MERPRLLTMVEKSVKEYTSVATPKIYTDILQKLYGYSIRISSRGLNLRAGKAVDTAVGASYTDIQYEYPPGARVGSMKAM